MDRCEACHRYEPTSSCLVCHTRLCQTCERVHARLAHDPAVAFWTGRREERWSGPLARLARSLRARSVAHADRHERDRHGAPLERDADDRGPAR